MPTLSRTRRTRLALAVVVILALTLLAACSSSSGGGGGGSSSGDITVKNLTFSVSGPVKAGATVTAKNNDDFAHTVTADDGTSFNVTVEPGKTATFTAPSTAGDYKFHCNIHPTMKHGTLTVQ